MMNNIEKAYYIQAARLSELIKKEYAEAKAGGSIDSGAINVGGKYFNAEERLMVTIQLFEKNCLKN